MKYLVILLMFIVLVLALNEFGRRQCTVVLAPKATNSIQPCSNENKAFSPCEEK